MDKVQNKIIPKKNKKKETKSNEIASDDDNMIQTTPDSDLEDDELGQDWSEIAKLSQKNSQLIIPKRGEKDYEPDGTNVQELLLYRVRKAMFDALENSARGTIIKNQVTAAYIFEKHKALVLNPKGTFLQTMGTLDGDGNFWLSFFEFLYLSERGTVTPFIMSTNNDLSINLDNQENTLIPVGIEDIYSYFKSQQELDQFSVYAHLKRLGFVVNPLSSDDTTYYPNFNINKFCANVTSIFKRMTSIYISQKTNLFNKIFYNPLHYKFIKYTSSPQIYEDLKLLVPYQFVPKTLSDLKDMKKEQLINGGDELNSSLQLTFNVWKPQTNYKKKNPDLPDYQVLVYNKNDNKQHFPNNDDLKHIFNSLNYKFEFLQDIEDGFDWDQNSYIDGVQRSVVLSRNQKKKNINKSQSKANNDKKPISSKKMKKKTRPVNGSSFAQQMRRLKNGYRSFLLAVMDNGIISFVKISEADFGSEDVWYVAPPKGTKTNKNASQRNRKNIRSKPDASKKIKEPTDSVGS